MMGVGVEIDFNNGGPTKKMKVNEEQEESKDVQMQEGGDEYAVIPMEDKSKMCKKMIIATIKGRL
jgi:hypothetical protein